MSKAHVPILLVSGMGTTIYANLSPGESTLRKVFLSSTGDLYMGVRLPFSERTEREYAWLNFETGQITKGTLVAQRVNFAGTYTET